MVGHRINAQADDLGVALVPLGLELRHVAELGRAHGREILRMREQDRPAVPDPLVEADLSLRGVGGEIRRLVTDANCHLRPPETNCSLDPKLYVLVADVLQQPLGRNGLAGARLLRFLVDDRGERVELRALEVAALGICDLVLRRSSAMAALDSSAVGLPALSRKRGICA